MWAAPPGLQRRDYALNKKIGYPRYPIFSAVSLGATAGGRARSQRRKSGILAGSARNIPVAGRFALRALPPAWLNAGAA